MSHAVAANELVDMVNNHPISQQYTSPEPSLHPMSLPPYITTTTTSAHPYTHTPYTNTAAPQYSSNADILANSAVRPNFTSAHTTTSTTTTTNLDNITDIPLDTTTGTQLTGIDWFMWQYSNWERANALNATLPSAGHPGQNTFGTAKQRVVTVSAYVAAKLLVGADYLGNQFVNLFGLTSSRYQYVVDAYDRYQREMKDGMGDESAVRQAANMELGQALSRTQPPVYSTQMQQSYSDGGAGQAYGHVNPGVQTHTVYTQQQLQQGAPMTAYNDVVQLHPALAPVKIQAPAPAPVQAYQPPVPVTPAVAPVATIGALPPNPFSSVQMPAQQYQPKVSAAAAEQSNVAYAG